MKGNLKHPGYHGHCKCGKTFKLRGGGPAWRFCVICDKDVLIEMCFAGVRKF